MLEEFRVVRPDGEVRTIYCESDLALDAAGNPASLVMIFKDVTQLRAAEEREREAQNRLQHSQKLEALGTLAGGVAHELNNALVPVLALAKTTAKRLPEHGRERGNLDMILKAGERARDLVQQILAFSRKEAPVRRSIDVAELVRDVMKMLRATMPSTVKMEARISPVPPLSGDPDKLNQVVTNLVTNAGQAIGNRMGTITVEVACVPSPANEAGLPLIQLSVRDTGVGMDEATVERIFEPFFTTKSVGEGTGLGLSVVHGIVGEHGGRIVVESRLGEGTRFDVFLPALVAEPARADSEGPQTR